MHLTRLRNWKTLSAAGVAVLVICFAYARFDAWLAARSIPEARMFCEQAGADELIVVVHGYQGGPETMADVLRAIHEKRPGADILFFHYPTRVFGNTDPFRLAAQLEEAIALRCSQHPYQRVRLGGHSMGALLVRKAYVYGCGHVEDAPVADGGAATKGSVHEWATKVDRIVLLAGMNRGWSADDNTAGMSLWGRTVTKVGLLLARASGTAKCIRSFERGEPFVANLRLQWLAVISDAKEHRANLTPPVVVQLLGDNDDRVSKADNRDVAVARDFVWAGVNNTGHSTILQLADEGTGWERKSKIQKAFGPEADIADLRRTSPTLVFETDTNVTTVVFVLHGIRDMGEWTSQFKKPLEEGFASQHAGTNDKIDVRRSAYGYFPMGAFLLWADRQQNVRWFMDEITELKARYPRLAKIHFIGHSNGTYVLASALEKYQTLSVGRVVFAGSVVRRDFRWSKFHGRVERVRNYVGSADWVVGFFPKLFELPGFAFINPDLGSAGYNGFEDGFVKDDETQFIQGGHGAALVTSNVQSIVDFILDGKKTEVSGLLVKQHPGSLDLASRLCWLVWLALAITLVLLGWLVTVVFNGQLFNWCAPKPGHSIGWFRRFCLSALKLLANVPFKLAPQTRGRIACAVYCGIVVYLLNTV